MLCPKAEIAPPHTNGLEAKSVSIDRDDLHRLVDELFDHELKAPQNSSATLEKTRYAAGWSMRPLMMIQRRMRERAGRADENFKAGRTNVAGQAEQGAWALKYDIQRSR